MQAPQDCAQLAKQLAAGRQFNYHIFSNVETEDQGYNHLSQWFAAPFRLEGTVFKTAEHFLVAEKARFFKDLPRALQALMAKTPNRAFKVGQEIDVSRNQAWPEKCLSLLVKGNFHKFNTHQHLKSYLLSTDEKVLVFADADPLLGVGLDQGDERLQDPSRWQGENFLGFSLMVVRTWLRVPGGPVH